MKTSSLL